MTYQLKRIDPFWHRHPMVPTGVLIGGICAAVGFFANKPIVAIFGGVVAAIAILAGTRPVISALLATLGLLGGLVSFVFVPSLSNEGMTIPMRLVSTALFSVFYMVLMDGLVLVVASLYNFFSGVAGLGGIRLELDGVDETESA
jgi:hypothetical protein